MTFPDIQTLLKKYRHLLTIQNAGLAVAVLISLSWVWGAVVTLQRNYMYQRQVDANNQQIELTKLQNKTYKYQQAYYKSNEYIELSARAKFGKALSGEHLVILPSSEGVKDTVQTTKVAKPVESESNFSRWMRFFFDAQ